jgi:hypothetical protein
VSRKIEVDVSALLSIIVVEEHRRTLSESLEFAIAQIVGWPTDKDIHDYVDLQIANVGEKSDMIYVLKTWRSRYCK